MKYRYKATHFFYATSLLVMLFSSCYSQPGPPAFHYELNQPEETIELPNELSEISGMTVLNDQLFACIQDEKGKIYFYNKVSDKIVDEIKFTKSGDFEDIARVKKKFYVLRSDGELFKYHYTKEKTAKQEIKLPNKLDYEGLCYWENEHALLIVPKEAQKKHHNIFYYDLEAKEIIDEFTIELRHKSIRKLLKKKYGIEDIKRFKPSGIAIHPISKQIYVIASVGKLLLVCNDQGKPLDIYQLDPKVFHQPEGIAFNEKAELFISNEANGDKANILVFSPK